MDRGAVRFVILSFFFLLWALSARPEPAEPSAIPGRISREDASKLKNPVAFTKASAGRGKALYLRHCQECHDADGRAMANITTEAADLTRPRTWRFGSSDGETFASIRDGAGDEMPPYKDLIKQEQDLWHVVNFMKTLGPEPPKFVEITGGQTPKGAADSAKPDPKKLKNPIRYTKAEIARGKALYLRQCQECHDADGRAMANITTEAADLTRPRTWRFGATPGETFRSIRDGAGDEMPPYKTIIKKDEDIWRVVTFLISIGPKSQRPKFSSEK